MRAFVLTLLLISTSAFESTTAVESGPALTSLAENEPATALEPAAATEPAPVAKPVAPAVTASPPATPESESASAEVARPAPEPKPGTVRVAGIVLKWLRADKQANFRRAEPMIRQAAAGGARVICTTECFLDGYAIADKSIPLETYRALGEPIPEGKYFRRLCALADELNVHLIAGMLETADEERFNTAVVIGPDGKLIGKYHKQKLGHESVRNTAGETSDVFTIPAGKLGVMICADRRDPDVVNQFRTNGAAFLICPSGGMFGPERNDPILQARSRETNRYIVFVHPAEFLVTAPDGEILNRVILGDSLLITPEQVGQAPDKNRVFYFDLPVTK